MPIMAQYDFAIGVRSGGTSGLTIKKNASDYALEGIIGFWNDGLSLTGLYERHPSIGEVPGLHWIYGAGGHVTFYNNGFRGNYPPSWYGYDREIDDGELGLGIDGIFGIEYKIPPLPIAISLDVKPFVEFTTNRTVWIAVDPGLGLKIAL